MNRQFKKKVVIINGSGGVGKDTFVGLVFNILNNKTTKFNLNKEHDEDGCGDVYYNIHYRLRNVSTIEPILFPAKELGWDGQKDEKGRKFLSDLKMLSNQYDFPHKYINRMYVDKGLYDILFIHCREPEEIKRFVDECGAVTLLIRRPGMDVPMNEADLGVENYDYDYVVYNSEGIKELASKAEKFVEWLLFKDEGKE